MKIKNVVSGLFIFSIGLTQADTIQAVLRPTPPPAPLVAVATLDAAHTQVFISNSLQVVTLPQGKTAQQISSGNFSIDKNGVMTLIIRMNP